jgi:hypothetical protein
MAINILMGNKLYLEPIKEKTYLISCFFDKESVLPDMKQALVCVN